LYHRKEKPGKTVSGHLGETRGKKQRGKKLTAKQERVNQEDRSGRTAGKKKKTAEKPWEKKRCKKGGGPD